MCIYYFSIVIALLNYVQTWGQGSQFWLIWAKVVYELFRRNQITNLADQIQMHLEEVEKSLSIKKVFWEISQNSQESTCTRVSFLIKLQTYGLLQNTSSGCFWNFYDGSCFVLFFLKGQCLWASRGILQPSRTFAMDFFCENS